MAMISPTLEGFRTALRRPAVTFGEIIWRWSVGATAAVLLLFGLFEYLNTLPVTKGELFFLRTRQPYLIVQALAHILRGSLNRAVLSLIVAALSLTLVWIIAASVGRIATAGALIEHFREKFELISGGREDERKISTKIPTLMRLNFLRAAVALAAVLGILGAGVLVNLTSPKAHSQPELMFFFLFLPVAALVCFAWWVLNWFLSLAGILAVRNGQDGAAAIEAAVTFCRERPGAAFAVSTWTGLGHLTAFGAATTLVSVPLTFGGVLPWQLVAVGVLVVTLAYFAIVDWLYVARMAGYLCIAEFPEALFAPPPAPPVIPTPFQTTIDRDEPILSDVPGLVAET